MSNDSPDDFLSHLPDTEWSVLEEMGREESGKMDWEADYSMAVVDYFRGLGRAEEDALNLAREFFNELFTEDGEDIFTGAFRGALKRALRRFIAGKESVQGFEVAERSFDRAWLISLMQKAVETLSGEMEKAGDERLFALLAPLLDGRPLGLPRSELASRLEVPVSGLTTTILKMGQRYRYFLEQEVRQSVTSSEELEEEIRQLQAVWN